MNVKNMSVRQRVLLMLSAFMVMALGAACTIRANIGITPISSFPYVLTFFSPLTVGEMTILMNVFFIVLQIVLLRKDYRWYNLAQLPVMVLYGYAIDGALFLLQRIPCDALWMRWVLCLAGTFLLATGIACAVQANLLVAAAEGLVLAVCQVSHRAFQSCKMAFDISLAVLSIVLSVGGLGRLEGIGVGTVLSALLLGPTIQLVTKRLFVSPQFCG